MKASNTIHGSRIDRVDAHAVNINDTAWVDVEMHDGDSMHTLTIFTTPDIMREIASAINDAANNIEVLG